jgi:hypothetical protein
MRGKLIDIRKIMITYKTAYVKYDLDVKNLVSWVNKRFRIKNLIVGYFYLAACS